MLKGNIQIFEGPEYLENNIVVQSSVKSSQELPVNIIEPHNGPQNGDNSDDGDDAQIGVVTKTRTKTKKPNMYRVLLLNDDFTPMEFVILVLKQFFKKSEEQATQVMLHVHNTGVGECGVFTYEIAETKVTQVMDFARANQHPLQCILEKQ